MSNAWKWLRKHWKPIAAVGCTAVAVGAIPVAPALTAAVGAVCTALAAKMK